MTKTLAMTGFPGGGAPAKYILNGKKLWPKLLLKRFVKENIII